MKKITETMLKTLENKFQTVESKDNVVSINTEYGNFTVSVDTEKNQFAVSDGTNTEYRDKFPEVIAFISSKRPTETKEETPALKPAEKEQVEPIQFYRLNTRDFNLDPMKLNTRLSNVLDHNYFNRGLAYTMYSKYLGKVEDTISKLNYSKAELVEDSVEYELVETQVELYTGLKSRIIAKRDEMGFSQEEISAWDSDRFIALVSYAVFGGKIELRNKYNVMNILENIKNIRYAGKQCDLKTLKEALNDIALDFATTADESGHYKNSRINVNSTMTEQIWQVCYRGAKQTKSGNFSNEKFAKRAGIEKEIAAQIVGKLQGSIDIED
jgi:hypothetical protein